MSEVSKPVASQVDLEAIRKRCEAEAERFADPNAAFEAAAERFHRATGMLAPGKDAGVVPWDREEREAEWRRWLAYDKHERHEAANRDREALLSEIERLRGGQQWRPIEDFEVEPFRRVFVCQADSESFDAAWSDEVEGRDWTHYVECRLPPAPVVTQEKK